MSEARTRDEAVDAFAQDILDQMKWLLYAAGKNQVDPSIIADAFALLSDGWSHVQTVQGEVQDDDTTGNQVPG